MNNLNNISEYQKIIFVNGLDESSPELLNNEELAGGLSTLSKNYPFVVFITKNSSISTNEFPITNMWFDGTRLTRFIGIDKKHNCISIGDHVLQLKFDYESGLLGIFDENTLENLRLINYNYIDINGHEVPLTSDNPSGINSISISAIDNQFKLKFRYNIQQNVENTNFNITSISKALSYKCNNISKLSGNSVNIVGNTQEDYEFTYKIVESTNGSPINETFTSEYAQDIVYPLSMTLYVNPISYNININGQIVSDIIHLEKDTEYTITLNFNPNNISSSYAHRLSVNILPEDYGTIDILSNNSVDILNGSCQFRIKTTNDVEANTSKRTHISFEVRYQNSIDGTGKYNSSSLNKSITIVLAGDESDKYFYFGYEDIDTFRRNPEMYLTNYSDKEIGTYIWGSDGNESELNNNQSDNYYIGKQFLCAIPMEYYNNNNVRPRWKAWVGDRNNLRSCLEWFEVKYQGIQLCGISYIILRRTLTGKFDGRIK